MIAGLKCPSCGGQMTCDDVLDIDHLSDDEHNIVWTAKCDDCGKERTVWVTYQAVGFELEDGNCYDCAYHVLAKYATGEVFDECESEYLVLDKDMMESGCKHFTRRRLEE